MHLKITKFILIYLYNNRDKNVKTIKITKELIKNRGIIKK